MLKPQSVRQIQLWLRRISPACIIRFNRAVAVEVGARPLLLREANEVRPRPPVNVRRRHRRLGLLRPVTCLRAARRMLPR
jgi:hypothetical protein